jgi:hypothetical protein
MPTPLRRRRVSGRRPLLVETAALIGAMTAKPSPARQALIDQTILSLKASGVWAKLDRLYFFAAHDAQASLLNWKDPAVVAVNTNAAAFVADQGYTGNGTTSYIDATFNPSSGTHNYVRNSASFGGWARTAALSTALDIGRGVTARNQVAFRTTADSIGSARINDVTTSTPADTTVATAVGLTALDRPDASSKQFFKNGAQIGATVSVASDATLPDAFQVGGSNGAGTSTRQFSMFFAGASQGATGQAALYSATLAYLQGVGAA